MTATGLGGCTTLSVGNSGTFGTLSYLNVQLTSSAVPAGQQSIVLSGVTLSTTAVASTNNFYVVTTQNYCSAGSIATGSISNSNPGGPSAPASTAATVILSAAAAFACALLLLI